MKLDRLFFAFICLVFLCIPLIALSTISFASDSPKAHATWWIDNFGVVTESENALVGRAQHVFDRVSYAADKRGSRLTRLIVLRGSGNPWALSIQDGSVIITEGGLKICYRGSTLEKGDSRLAFVFGHELAHLAKDDFWHSFAYSAITRNAGEQKLREKLLDELHETDATIHAKELQADFNGILYMTIAGYDPKQIVGDKTNFFEEWVSQITGKIAYSDAQHPSASERAAFLKAQLKDVINEEDLYLFGTRLYQLERYDDALLLLSRFNEKFPSREVFNNIGLAHFQLAVKILSVCNESQVLHFKLPTIVDTESLVKSINVRSSGSESCIKSDMMQKHMHEAIRNFEAARDRDPLYLPVFVNLSSVYLLSGEYSKALAIVDEGLAVNSQYPELLNNKALALYLFGKATSIETADNALDMLRLASEKDPSLTDSVYNTAAILRDRGRNAAANVILEHFLQLENNGLFADQARKYLGAATKHETEHQGKTAELKSPFPLGFITANTRKLLEPANRRSFTIGNFSADIYEFDSLKLLAIADSIEIVQTEDLRTFTTLDVARDTEGALRTVKSANGVTLIHPNYMIDLVNGLIVRIVFFSNN